MTNDVFDPVERNVWPSGPPRDPRFRAVLRIDPLLLGWPDVGDTLAGSGTRSAPTWGPSRWQRCGGS